MSRLNITPLTGALGAEVSGIDLTGCSDAELAALNDAFHQYLVLCIRDQDMTPADLMALTNRLGGPGDTPYLTGLPDYPDVVPIIKAADEKSPHSFGAGWHTDFTFQPEPPDRTLLYAVETPTTGGDTLYCNLYAAYDLLSDGMKAMLGSLTCLHSAVRSYGPRATLKDHMEHMEIHNDEREPEEFAHPVIRVHPVTGRKALWVNPTYSIRFTDMTEAESNTLLNYLNALAVQPALTCRVRWTPGTLTMWDNRCTQHCAVADYHGQRRHMLRTTTRGDNPIAA